MAIEYKAISEPDLEFLNVEVMNLVDDGWEPLGGISVA